MHILVVEDEAKIRHFLCDALKAEGYSAEPCESYEAAEGALKPTAGTSFDAVILDRMLQGKDGANLLPLIRKNLPECNVLVLSALNSPEEKAGVLDKGADDYLSKPFSVSELSARLRALKRRGRKGAETEIRIGDSHLDLLDHTFRVGEKKVEISNREYQILLLFMRGPGRIQSRYQLLEKVWNTRNDIESNVVEVTINNLRRKLEAVDCKLKILSKRNIGYWLEV